MNDAPRLTLPPNADESEREVVAALVLRPDAMDAALAVELRPEHFRVDWHGETLRTALQLRQNGIEDLDPVMVVQESDGRIDPDELTNVLEQTFATGHVEFHANVIVEAARRRGVRHALHSGLRLLEDGNAADDVLAEVGTQAESVFESGADGPEHIGDVLLRMGQRGEEPEGLSTGIGQLDDLIGGLRPGHFAILAARPGHGKTALGSSLARHAARQGNAVLFVSLEMASTELAERLLSLQSGVEHQRIRDGNLDELDAERLMVAQNELAECPLRILDRTPLRVSDITVATRLAVRRDGLRLLVIDYLQLIEPADRKVIREQQVAEMSRTLKTLAKSVGIPILCLAQLNRGLESRDNKRPRLSDLRESGSIEQDADVVMFLHRAAASDPEADPRDALLIVGKNRHGQTGDVPLEWTGSRMEFREGGLPQ